jgi:hypothetical protein
MQHRPHPWCPYVKSKIARHGGPTSEVCRVPAWDRPSCCRYRLCYLRDELASSGHGQTLYAQSHNPRNCNFAWVVTLLQTLLFRTAPSGGEIHRAQARASICSSYSISVPTASSGVLFPLRPGKTANCASFWLLQRLLASVESPGEIHAASQDSRPFP